MQVQALGYIRHDQRNPPPPVRLSLHPRPRAERSVGESNWAWSRCSCSQLWPTCRTNEINFYIRLEAMSDPRKPLRPGKTSRRVSNSRDKHGRNCEVLTSWAAWWRGWCRLSWRGYKIVRERKWPDQRPGAGDCSPIPDTTGSWRTIYPAHRRTQKNCRWLWRWSTRHGSERSAIWLDATGWCSGYSLKHGFSA